MTIGPDFVFLCVPRTASVSISRCWLLQYGGVEWNPPKSYHDNVVPSEHAHKFTFAVVRNPYDRMASLWRFTRLFTSEQRAEDGIPEKGGLTEFVEFCIQQQEPRWLSQAAFLQPARLDFIARFENLESDMNNLPFVKERHPLPCLNRSVRPSLWDDLDWRAIEIINQHSAEDFSKYGYILSDSWLEGGWCPRI